jgi:hypothetical protein
MARALPRRFLLFVVVLALAAVASASVSAASTRLSVASAETTAAGTAQFTLAISGTVGQAVITTRERGSVSFTRRAAHVYKLVPNSPYPEEQIVVGPLTYSNANLQQALDQPGAKPWTKLDTRKLPKSRRLGDLDHVRALAYLAGGSVGTKQIGPAGALTHFSASVEPKRVLAGVPPSQRAAVAAVLRSDYTAKPFRAEFWLDAKSRVRRVRVAYRTTGGTTITILGTFTAFGSRVDLKLPPKRDIVDITPK